MLVIGANDELVMYNAMVRDLFTEIYLIKEALANDDFESASAIWYADMTSEQRYGLWRAPKKGGIFTTKERAQMKSDDWSKA